MNRHYSTVTHATLTAQILWGFYSREQHGGADRQRRYDGKPPFDVEQYATLDGRPVLTTMVGEDHDRTEQTRQRFPDAGPLMRVRSRHYRPPTTGGAE